MCMYVHTAQTWADKRSCDGESRVSLSSGTTPHPTRSDTEAAPDDFSRARKKVYAVASIGNSSELSISSVEYI